VKNSNLFGLSEFYVIVYSNETWLIWIFDLVRVLDKN
jgi:hypothetical protein